MQGTKIASGIVTIVMLALSCQISAETVSKAVITKGDPVKGKEIASQVCAGCHNADGNSTIPANPVLAGQHAEYITKQLANFKSHNDKPAERNNPVMGAMVAPLSTEDMRDLGAYYAQQVRKPVAAKDKALAELGERIYRGGHLGVGLPACASCHAPNGAGIPPNYPRIAGQHADYTITQLRAFRTGQRSNDVNSTMRAIADRMSEKEIQAVAEFIAGLR